MSKYIIDISYHNGSVDLSKAKKYIAGVVFHNWLEVNSN